MERAFRIFDKDGSGTVSLAEFIETMHQFSGQGEDEKISFSMTLQSRKVQYFIQVRKLRLLNICYIEFSCL